MERISQPHAEKDAMLARVLIHSTDFELLRAQKTVLVNLQSKEILTPAEEKTIEGMLNLLDAIQDIAVDHYGFKKEYVLNLMNEETEELTVSLEDCEKIAESGNEFDGDATDAMWSNWK